MSIDISGMTADEVRDLYKALLRAAAAEQGEVARAGRLLTTGYEARAGGTLSPEADRAAGRMRALREMAGAVRSQMEAAGIKPW